MKATRCKPGEEKKKGRAGENGSTRPVMWGGGTLTWFPVKKLLGRGISSCGQVYTLCRVFVLCSVHAYPSRWTETGVHWGLGMRVGLREIWREGTKCALRLLGHRRALCDSPPGWEGTDYILVPVTWNYCWCRGERIKLTLREVWYNMGNPVHYCFVCFRRNKKVLCVAWHLWLVWSSVIICLYSCDFKQYSKSVDSHVECSIAKHIDIELSNTKTSYHVKRWYWVQIIHHNNGKS